jgi:hypothetical protein
VVKLRLQICPGVLVRILLPNVSVVKYYVRWCVEVLLEEAICKDVWRHHLLATPTVLLVVQWYQVSREQVVLKVHRHELRLHRELNLIRHNLSVILSGIQTCRVWLTRERCLKIVVGFTAGSRWLVLVKSLLLLVDVVRCRLLLVWMRHVLLGLVRLMHVGLHLSLSRLDLLLLHHTWLAYLLLHDALVELLCLSMLLIVPSWILLGRWLKGRNLDNIVNVAMRIGSLRLIFSTHPLVVDNELVLMVARVRHREEEIELSVADSLHGYRLPLSESACNVNLIAAMSPLEQVLIGGLLLGLSLVLHLWLV